MGASILPSWLMRWASAIRRFSHVKVVAVGVELEGLAQDALSECAARRGARLAFEKP